ncbi:MAG: M56 family peptidase, partial [Flavobacteriaceae bacterium]
EEYEAMEEQHTDGKTIIIKKVRKGDDQFSFITKDSDEEEDIIAVEEGNGTFFLIDTEGDESPLFRIDGKEATEGEAKKLAPDQIESINVYKGAKALEKFGDKAKDGVVEITTKKQE